MSSPLPIQWLAFVNHLLGLSDFVGVFLKCSHIPLLAARCSVHSLMQVRTTCPVSLGTMDRAHVGVILPSLVVLSLKSEGVCSDASRPYPVSGASLPPCSFVPPPIGAADLH